ncbi:MAG: hypothetical protein ACRET4_14875 [Steroidobacteraceae bacterium]
MFRSVAWLTAPLLMLQAATLADEPVYLKSGTRVRLELQQHITSAYTAQNSDIYFRVAEDVMSSGELTIRRGTLVRGVLQQATDTGMAGRSGTMTVAIREVTATDGRPVRIVSSTTRTGRDREGAVVGWVIFWGIPGLITRGVSAYAERGAIMEAQVLTDTRIDAGHPMTGGDALPALVERGVRLHDFSVGGKRAKGYRLHLEQPSLLKTIDFKVDWPANLGDARTGLATLALVAVDGTAVPEPSMAVSASAKSVSFESWSILRYCRDGRTELRFRGTTATGEAYDVIYPIDIRIAGKK